MNKLPGYLTLSKVFRSTALPLLLCGAQAGCRAEPSMTSTTVAPQAATDPDIKSGDAALSLGDGDGDAPHNNHRRVDSSMAESDFSLRIATYNIEDVRTAALLSSSNEKLGRVAATIQRIQPDVLFINEISYDQEGGPDFPGGEAGRNAQRFADHYLAVSQGTGLKPLSYTAVMRPSNTGVPFGLDLDHVNGVVSAPGKGYGGDCWGYGDFLGQYALAVLVRSDLKVREKEIRTFQKFPWSAMPGALRPKNPETGVSWYSDAEWAQLRLSSKTHMDVPVELPDGRLLHLLASHPTPPSFDGAEDRNGARNHDEIR